MCGFRAPIPAYLPLIMGRELEARNRGGAPAEVQADGLAGEVEPGSEDDSVLVKRIEARELGASQAQALQGQRVLRARAFGLVPARIAEWTEAVVTSDLCKVC